MCEEAVSPAFLCVIVVTFIISAIFDPLVPFEYTVGPLIAIVCGLWMWSSMKIQVLAGERAKNIVEHHLAVLTQKIRDQIGRKHEDD